jgi:chromosome segregation ATPase
MTPKMSPRPLSRYEELSSSVACPPTVHQSDHTQETSTQSDVPTEPIESDSKPNGSADDSNGNGHPAATDDSTAGNTIEPPNSNETDAKLESITQERDELKSELEQLRTEVDALRRSGSDDVVQLRTELEALKGSGNDDVAQLRTELEEANSAKEQAEEAYQGLLERVNHLKTTLGDRLKRDRAELEEAKERIEELETQNEQLQDGSKDFEAQISKLKEELQDAAREATSLRSRGNLSQQNWVKERDELARLVSSLKEEVETTTNAMGEWEIIAMEERSVKESLVEKVAELEEQATSLRDNYQNAAAERDSQSKAIDNLQTALSDIQEARRRELREMVETSEEQLQALKKLVHEADLRAQKAEAARENLEKELERTAPFEKEVKEKNLLIGKLRHEAIVLNDHLTKALRYLKKTKPEDNVDR